GWHGYGLARLSRRRCHLMISFGRARTVCAAPLLHHARSKERVSQQIRTIWAAAPDAAQAPAVWAAGSSLRAAPVSWQLCARVGRLCLLAGFALGRFFVRLATLHLTKNALALHLLFEGPESLFDIVIANEYLQNVSNRGGIPEVSDNNAKLEYRGCTRFS